MFAKVLYFRQNRILSALYLFESQLKSYKQDTWLTILRHVNKTRAMFFSHNFNILVKYLFQADLSILLFILSINKEVLTFNTFILCIKNKSWHFHFNIQNVNKSFVYIAKNCKPCNSLISGRMTPKFWLPC